MYNHILADQRGFSHFIIIAVVGLLLFIIAASLLPFGNSRLSFLFPKPASHAAEPWVGVPDLPVDYNQDVLTWWNAHPFNPQSANYRPEIISPTTSYNVRTQFGGNIQAAVDAAAAAGGGTIVFPTGTYSGTFELIGASNIHFVGQGKVTIKLTETITIAGCRSSIVTSAIATLIDEDNSEAIACITTGRNKNIYFKNLIFDGENTLLQAMAISATKDLVFDTVTFSNFVDPGKDHRGIVSGSVGLNNIWFRNSNFLGKERYAISLSGLHGGGVIQSTIDGSFGVGGFLFSTNDELTKDYNKNGIFEPAEKRTADHIVIAQNSFTTPVYNGVTATGRDILVLGNIFQYGMNAVADFDAKSSDVNSTVQYEYFGNMVINNTTKNIKYLAEISASPICHYGNNCSKQGRATIMGNTVENAPSYIDYILTGNTTFGTVDGPHTISGNCINTAECTPVGPALPNAVPSPTATPLASTPPSSTGSAMFR